MTTQHNIATDNQTPRLQPVEKPDSIKLKMAYWMTRRQMGKVITPMKVVYARIPGSLKTAQTLMKQEERLSLDASLKLLVKRLVATLNGCAFCADMARARSGENGQVQAQTDQLLNYRNSAAFSASEKAALGYAEEITEQKTVSDKTFQQLESHFSEQEIAELTWLVGLENYYNLINRALRISSDELCSLWHNGDSQVE